MKTIYLDHAASTPLEPRVREAMLPYLETEFGNPSSFHGLGKKAKDAIDEARASIAKLLEVKSDELIFTSGGTESINLAILGAARANSKHGKHLITSAIEHHAVLGAMEHLEKKEGFMVTVLPVDEFGRVSVAEVEKAIRPDTILISIMLANNEIGTVEPVAEIGKMLGERLRESERGGEKGSFSPLLHTDACQAAGALSIKPKLLGVDLLTINGSKIYGPKGSGLLYVRAGVKIEPIMFGGFQERGLRPGTENVGNIVGLAKALEIAFAEREAESKRLTALRDEFIVGLKTRVPKIRLNGHPTERLPNNVNVSILDIEGEALTLYLDAKGIEASTGSACTSTSLDPSHVILATGLPYEAAHGSIRFTLGRSTTKADLDYVLEVLPSLVEKLRAMSPVKMDGKYVN